MRFSHILVDQKFEAEDLLRHLQGGQAFAELAKKYSKCSSSKSEGDLGEVPLSRLDSDFRESAEILKPNQLSGVVRTKFGYHLILRTK